MAGELNFCVVCGEGSNREKWEKTKSATLPDKTAVVFVACDYHTDSQFTGAVQKAVTAGQTS